MFQQDLAVRLQLSTPVGRQQPVVIYGCIFRSPGVAASGLLLAVLSQNERGDWRNQSTIRHYSAFRPTAFRIECIAGPGKGHDLDSVLCRRAPSLGVTGVSHHQSRLGHG